MRIIMEAYWKRIAENDGLHFATMFPIHQHKDVTPETLENETRDVSELVDNYILDSKDVTVMELGAGMGRLSGLLATHFKEVVATDFIEEFVTKNKELNQLPNVTHSVVNATQLQCYDSESFGSVFSNWLLMYMSDKEVHTFAENVLRILKPNGYVIFRESHFYPSVNVGHVDGDPTVFRTLEEYHKAFVDAKYASADKQDYVFEFVVGQTSPSSQRFQKNIAEVFWIWQKKKVGETPVRDLQLWADFDEECGDVEEGKQDESTVPYPEEGFGTPGGLMLMKRVLSKVNIQPENKVVEVGSGSGGAMKYITEEFSAQVTGVECMVNDVEKSIRMLNALGLHRENVVIGDVKSIWLPESTYDLVSAREFIQCAPDKPEYCQQFMKWLKPGGQVLVAGFFIEKDCEATHDFVKGFGWPPLCTTKGFAKLLEESGFVEISVEDYTNPYMTTVNDHLANYKGLSESDSKMWNGFVKSFQKQFDEHLTSWSIVTAKKPIQKPIQRPEH